MKAIHKAVGSYTLCGRFLRDTMIAGDVPTCKYCIAGGVGPHKKVVAILKESTPSEPKIPLNYAQRAVRDETGKVIRFEPLDKARLKEALKEVKAKNKEIRDSYQADNETMSFRAAKESTPLTEQETEKEVDLLDKFMDEEIAYLKSCNPVDRWGRLENSFAAGMIHAYERIKAEREYIALKTRKP